MERISHRESLLLGYSARRSFMNEQSSSQEAIRGSEIDFNDVFGGPPRRSSMHDIRCSCSDREATDSHDGDDKTIVSRNSWNCIREKPVFGEEVLNGRRHRSDKFFDDIFKGNASSAPRKREWDHPFSLSPVSSRVSSPARPLPPKADPSETPFPADFSLPAKLTKGVELPAYGSSPRFPEKSKDGGSSVLSHSSSPLLRSSSLKYSHEERNDTQPSYRQSILSRELSLGSKDADLEAGGHSKVESHSSEILTTGNPFHFSIYKWASKEVPFVMSLRGVNSSKPKERIDARCSSSNEWVESKRELPKETFHGTNLPLHEGVPPNTKSFTTEHDNKKESTPMATSTVNREETWPRVDPGNATSQNTREETIPHSQSDKNVLDELEKVSVVAEEAPKSEMKPLGSLFYGDSDYAPCIKEPSKKDSERESKVQDSKQSSGTLMPTNKKNQDGRRGSGEVGKGSIQGSPMNSKDPGKTRFKGKVKEFVNIFNQETLSKTKTSVDPQSRSSRVKDIGNSKAEKEASLSNVAADEKIHLSSEPEKKPSPDTPIMVNDNLPHSEKQHSIKNTNSMSNRTSGWKNSSSTEIQGNSSKEVAAVIDEPFQENFLVNELTQDENKLQKTGIDPEEIQVIDVTIRRWSNEKDKNIRSLLTTLQYVLWPGSGWKPVPLVDIIEGTAVKRCYQKALLCLHPDKLQQKSATSEQKYLAEKVFDILQDAWGHFNSLGSL